jgi:replicative DNA helicase
MRKNLRVIPHNLDAEQALLGAIMLKPESMHDISVSVYPESFYADKHREIFSAMLDIFTKSNPIDLLSVTHKLKDRNALDKVGGASYLTELIETVPAASNANYYAEVVQDKAVLRGLIRAADDIAEIGFGNPEDVDEALDNAEKKIYQVTQSPTAQKFTPIKNSLGEAWDRLDRLHNAQDEIRGVQTGFPALDNLLAGLQKSDLILLAARPSVGKTSFALDIARNAACIYNTPVGFFSLEMSSQQLVDRMLAAEAKVDAWKLRTGKLSTDEEFSLVQEAMGRLADAPIHIDDQPGNSILKMRSAARRLKNEHGLGLIVVDYLQLMMPTNMKYHDSMVQQVTEISRALKIMARELDVPVLALSQLSRAVEQRGGKPRLSDLRDSGCLAGDTLVVRADTGERVPINELVGKENVPLLSLDGEYRLLPAIASRVFSSGRKRVFALTTRSGRRIKASGNHPFLTFAGWQRLDALEEKDHVAVSAHHSPNTSNIVSDELFTSTVSRSNVATLAKAVSSEKLLHLAESDVYWDEVVSIETLGVEEVYDMTVPGTHNFVADDFIVHNSLEQDADVVMFIHRDDKTNENSERPNIAEILVEKHRNGPTGKIELYFDEKRTTFLSLETKRGGEENFGTPQEDDF